MKIKKFYYIFVWCVISIKWAVNPVVIQDFACFWVWTGLSSNMSNFF